MKLSLSILFILYKIIYPNITISQTFDTRVEVGINIGDWSESPPNSSIKQNAIVGPLIGASIDINLRDYISFSAGLNYIRKGTVFKTSTTNSKAKLDYFQVPFLLRAKFPMFGVNPYIVGGPILGILASAKDETTDSNQTKTYDIKNAIYPNEFSLLMGLGVDFNIYKTNYFIQTEYEMGISVLYKNNDEFNFRNNGFHIVAGVRFRIY